MKIDVEVVAPLRGVAARAGQLADAGADGILTFEDSSDPFFPLLLAATSSDLDLYSSCAVAFPRSPTHLAQAAWELQSLSGGRFALGIAPQVRPHVERRFSAVWGRPVAHMGELIDATKAVFDCWQKAAPLSFAGDYYNLSLMTPAFAPAPLADGLPPIWLGALGPRMTELAATKADGQIVHGFHTQAYLRDHLLPTLDATLVEAGRARDEFTVAVNVIVGSGIDETERAAAREAVRFLLGFYGSTPAYRVALEVAGWGTTQERLNALSKQGRWRELAAEVSDEMIDTIAVVGSPEEVAERLWSRYGDVADRVGVYTPAGAPDRSAEIVEAFRSR